MAVSDAPLIISIRILSGSSWVLRESDRIRTSLLVQCMRWSSRIMLKWPWKSARAAVGILLAFSEGMLRGTGICGIPYL